MDYTTVRHQKVDTFLKESRLLEHLRDYRPVLTGTIPIGVDVPDSDLDIACEVHDFPAFERNVSQFLHDKAADAARFTRKEIRGVPCVIARFKLGEYGLELFGQPVPVSEQYSFRHMALESRVLRLGGVQVRERIMDLRRTGLKTEPAFAQVLGLQGDPYEALLELESWTDEQIRTLAML